MSSGKDGRRVTARSKGKVERPFRTVKEAHETLYHFHEPENEAEANLWLRQYLLHYNDKPHRTESHSRIEDWLRNLPKSGLKEMCNWERFCNFAREPQRRKVGADARVSVEGVAYEVEPDLAGETVLLWWGLFDNEPEAERLRLRCTLKKKTSATDHFTQLMVPSRYIDIANLRKLRLKNGLTGLPF